MSTTTPTADDLRASLLAALAAVGHAATIDAHGRLTFAADGAAVEVQIQPAFCSQFSSKATPAAIVFARFSPRSRRFCPRSGVFDWPLVARTAVEIAAALRADDDARAQRDGEEAKALARAYGINASLALPRDAAIRASAEHGRLVLMVGGRGSVEANEEQIRAMVAAARACGLVAERAAESGEER